MLSITIDPDFVAFGTNFLDTIEPGEDKTISVFLKLNFSKSSTVISLSSPYVSFVPSDLFEASAWRFLIGKLLWSKIFRISLPTFPVAPTTAKLSFFYK